MVGMDEYKKHTLNLFDGTGGEKEEEKKVDEETTRSRKCMTLFFTVFGFLISTADLVSDWYNTGTYSSGGREFEKCNSNKTPEEIESEVHRFTIQLYTVVSMGTISFIVETIALIISLHYARKGVLSVPVNIFQEVSAGTTLLFEDTAMLTIITIDLLSDACTMFQQLRTNAGVCAIFLTAASVTFRGVYSLTSCCVCDCRREREEPESSRCSITSFCMPFRIIRSIVLVLNITLVITIMVLAYRFQIDSFEELA